MIQLCYASQRVDSGNDLLQDLSDILTTARQFNHQHQIIGVLYYAEGCFFQCLEGEKTIVETIFQRICKDPRHHQIHRFPDQSIQKQHFYEWSMKYVHKHSEIAALFARHGLGQFQPDQLNTEQLKDLLRILVRVKENRQELSTAKVGYKQRGYVPYL